MQKKSNSSIDSEQKNKDNKGTHEKLQEKILENLVELQKVHTNLAERFDKLSENITNLLSLFEMAARSFAQNPANQVNEKDKDFLEKIDRLLDQNKTIARGLTLMEERIRERVYGMPKQQESVKEEEYISSQINRPLPKF